MRRHELIAILYVAACGTAAGQTGSTPTISPVVKVVNSIRITVDPRVELMSIAQEIGGFRDSHPFLLTKDSSGYRQHVQQAFSEFRNHRAVIMVADLSKRGFNFSRPPFVMLHLDGNLYGDSRAAGDRALQNEKKRGAVLIDELLAGVRDYAASRDRTAKVTRAVLSVPGGSSPAPGTGP